MDDPTTLPPTAAQIGRGVAVVVDEPLDFRVVISVCIFAIAAILLAVPILRKPYPWLKVRAKVFMILRAILFMLMSRENWSFQSPADAGKTMRAEAAIQAKTVVFIRHGIIGYR